MTLPTFLVIGANKAGTTSLYYYLRQHPEIFMSSIKEPQFFAFDAPASDPRVPGARADTITTIADYQALFAKAGAATAIGEASTSYLYSEIAPERIRHHVPGAKLIALLRDPVERAYSNYLHNVRDGVEPLDEFADALAVEGSPGREGPKWRYRDKGRYSVQIARYLRHFPRDQLRFFLYEDFDADPRRVLHDIYAFVGVSDDFVQDLSVRLNVSGVPKSRGVQSTLNRQQRLKWAVEPFIPSRLRRLLLQAQAKNLVRPAISPQVRSYLVEFYREDVTAVQEMTGLDVSGWLRAPDSGG